MIAPLTAFTSLVLMPTNVSMLEIMPKMKAPNTVLLSLPLPPSIATPPMTTMAMAFSS